MGVNGLMGGVARCHVGWQVGLGYRTNISCLTAAYTLLKLPCAYRSENYVHSERSLISRRACLVEGLDCFALAFCQDAVTEAE